MRSLTKISLLVLVLGVAVYTFVLGCNAVKTVESSVAARNIAVAQAAFGN